MKLCKAWSFAFLIVASGVCATAGAEDRFVSKEGGFSVQFPAGWTPKPKGQEVRAMNAAGDASASVEFSRLPNGVTVDRYIEMNMGSFKKTLNEYKKEENGLVNVPAINSQARWNIISFKGDNGPVKILYYYIFSVKDRKLFVVSCAANPENFDKNRAEFDSIARSLVQF